MDLQLQGKRALVSAGHKGIDHITATRLLVASWVTGANVVDGGYSEQAGY